MKGGRFVMKALTLVIKDPLGPQGATNREVPQRTECWEKTNSNEKSFSMARSSFKTIHTELHCKMHRIWSA